ncbi:MAG TPA: cytochrome c oxidase subunit II [Bdellovibrionota bacterium]|nr:cytochrome c oxidase subunit II [Bdellovibrionota bacterium]
MSRNNGLGWSQSELRSRLAISASQGELRLRQVFSTGLRRAIAEKARALVVAGIRRVIGISSASMLLMSGMAASAQADSIHLPIAATVPAGKWDDLYLFLIWLSVFFFILVCGAMVYFAIVYRHTKTPRTKYITGNHMLEGIWIAVPTVLLMVIFGWGYWVYREMTQAPSDAYEIRVIGKQWAWTFVYDTHDPTTGVMYAPLGRPVKLVMTSEDVLHSFFIPNFRVKQDVVPGMFTSVWFEATVPGVHQVYCAEYCGGSHSGMLAKVVILKDDEWKAFQGGATPDIKNFPVAGSQVALNDSAITTSQAAPAQAKTAPVSLADRGKHVFEQKGCISCHNPAAGDTTVGPSPQGLFMKTVELQDGSLIKADESYIRESIVRPQARLVKGFNPVMPTFQGLMDEQEMAAVIAYIKSLK